MSQGFDDLKFGRSGGIRVVIQDTTDGEVLATGLMNQEALAQTIATGKTHLWSRRRDKVWMKGQRTGNAQSVRAILVDCKGEMLLVKVEQSGAACHRGYRSCFYRQLQIGNRFEAVAEPITQPVTKEKSQRKHGRRRPPGPSRRRL